MRAEFEAVALPHLDALYSVALKMTRDAFAAEDLVQDTFVRAYRFFSRFQRGTNCKAWLFKILKNTFINRFRQSRRQPEQVDFGAIEEHSEASLLDRSEPGSRNPEELVDDGSLDGEVQAALARLPPEFRMVVVLSIVEGYSYKEIAAIMSCPIGTVMSRLHRARRILQVDLVHHAAERGLVSDLSQFA
ncbi:MAG TPA: sigma-70 family RNA polymerase sigma factor [Candidatus Polarisedimenticolia bacterium]|nr:sigma-70 family RNA polymerase sigma factor [Candidatus Polarisedimenticolia bacterium]